MGGIPPQQFTCQLEMMISLSWAKMKLTVCLGASEEIVSGHGKLSQLPNFVSVLRSYWRYSLKYVPHAFHFQIYWYSLDCHLFVIRFFPLPVSSHSSWNMLTNKLVLLLNRVALGTFGVWVHGQRAGKVQKKVSAFFQVCFLHSMGYRALVVPFALPYIFYYISK